MSLALNHGISQTALEFVSSLRAEGGEIIAVHVYQAMQGSVKIYVSDEVVANVEQRAGDLSAERVGDAPDIKPVMLTGHSGRTITDYGKAIGTDCVVVGFLKPGLSDYFLGSTTARIVCHTPCSVHVLR